MTDTQWEAAPGAFSPDGKHFTYVINHDGMQDVHLAARDGTSTRLALADGVTRPGEFSPDGTRLLIDYEGPQQPSDLFVYDVAEAKTTQLTFSSVASLSRSSLPPAEVIHYRSFDGRTISERTAAPSANPSGFRSRATSSTRPASTPTGSRRAASGA